MGFFRVFVPGRNVPWQHAIKMLIIKLLRGPSPGGHLSKQRQCQQPLARYHKLFTHQETNFIDSTQSRAEALKQELRLVPQEQQLCQGAANTWPRFHTGGLPLPGQDWSAGSTRVTLEQAPAGCLMHPEYPCFVLIPIQERKKLTHNFFFQPYLPKETKKIPC